MLPGIAAAVRRATRAEDSGDVVGDGKVPDRAAGVREGWRAIGPTHKQRYLAYDPTESEAAGKPAEDKPGKAKGKAKGD